MEKKRNMKWIVGLVAAVVILTSALCLVLPSCNNGGSQAPSTEPTQAEQPDCTLYWNMDLAEYGGKSEAGMSSRMPEADGYFHIRFFTDGQMLELKVADRKIVNAIDVQSLMGLEFDENGTVVGVINVDDMPINKLAWQFYVQSFGGKALKLNSSSSMNGIELLLDCTDNTRIYDMTGMEGPVGTQAKPIPYDRIMGIANTDGELTHVFIYDRPNYMLTHEGACVHCGKTVTWSEWTKTNELPVRSGHYQLQNDVTLKAQAAQQADTKLCLDLNGKRVDGGENTRVFSMHNSGAELAIMDTSEAQTGVMAAHGTSAQGLVVWVRYGRFYLYGGTLDASDSVSNKNGAAVCLEKNNYFYMYGGTLIGGKATYRYNEETKKYSNGVGGTLSMAGKFVMYDGVIRDGYAQTKVTAYNTDGSPKTYQRGVGGNIYIGSTGVMEMHGGVIKNGRAGNVGANIYMDGNAELTIYGGSIQGGKITGKSRNGGSIYITSKATLYMKGGSITGGTCCNGGGNIYMNGKFVMSGGYIGGGTIRSYATGKVVEDAAHRNLFVVNGNFQMYGGKIDGGVRATDSNNTDTKKCQVVLSGYATIDGGEKSNRNLTLSLGAGGPVQLSVGKPYDRAKIRVNAVTGIFTKPTGEHNADNFLSDVPGADIFYHDGCIALGKKACLCGASEAPHLGKCDGVPFVWVPLTATSQLAAGGHYYLTADISSAQVALGEGVVTGLDLNGYSYSASNNNCFLINGAGAHLNLCDHAGTGSLRGRGFPTPNQGGAVYVRVGSMDIYGGTITKTEDYQCTNHGGLLSVRGTVNMYGGTVSGGVSPQGGNISVTSSGEFTLHDGVITGGSATEGGNIFTSGSAKVTILGGTVTDGTASTGGNLCVLSGTTLTMGGGNVDGDIHLDNTDGPIQLTLSGKLTVGKGKSGNGMRIPDGMLADISRLHKDASLCVSAGGYFAQGATAETRACFRHAREALSIALDADKLFVGHKSCLCGQKDHVGDCDGKLLVWMPLLTTASLTKTGNYYLIENMTCSQISPKDGVVISVDLNGHTLSSSSGRVFMPYETTTLNICDHAGGGKLLGMAYSAGNEAQGGVVYVRAGSTMNVYGGTIGAAEGYGAANHGGIISVRGTLNMYDGTVVGGKATLYGGCISVTNASSASFGVFNFYGGTVKGGTAPTGGSIYVATGKANILGGSAENVAAIKGSTLALSGGRADRVTVSGGTLQLSGSPVIGELITETDAEGNKPVVTAAAALTEGADITVTDKLSDGVFTDTTLGGYAAFFHSKDPDRGIFAIDNPVYSEELGALYLGQYHCVCGKANHVGSCDGKAVKWTALTDAASLKTSGSYYMTGDISTAQISLGKGIVTNLDLNGHNLIASGSNLFLINGDASTKLTLCDTRGGGTLQGRGFATASQGGAVYIRAGNMDIYGGTVCKAKNYQVTNHGGLISVRGTLHMYDGTIEGGTSQEYGGNVSVSASGIFYLHGGTITGGSAPKGGNICVTSSAKLYIQGGKVENGIASESGGNVYVDKQNTVVFEMTGGELLGGTATVSGGNLFVLDAVGTKSITGGTVTGGSAPTGSCAYVAAGSLTVGTDATVEKLETP